MKIAKEITLWSLDVYKIHIKEWPTVKDKILSLVPWDDINQRKNPEARENLDDSPHEMTWTDYYLQGGESLDCYEMASHGIDLRSCADHIDYEFTHKGAILYLNTCDGYTYCDGHKVKSVANRILLHDPSKLHHSTATTDQPRRVICNVNYL